MLVWGILGGILMAIRSYGLVVFATIFSITFVDPAFAQATTSVKCSDGSVVTVSTGSKEGKCTKSPKGNVAICTDVLNTSGGGCSSKTGALCFDTEGAGECTIKTAEQTAQKRKRTGADSSPADTLTINPQ